MKPEPRLVPFNVVGILREKCRTTDDGSSQRLAEILKWADGYVAELPVLTSVRHRATATTVGRSNQRMRTAACGLARSARPGPCPRAKHQRSHCKRLQ